MSIIDPISDMLTRIRNAYSVKKESVTFDSSNLKISILNILKEKGYIEGFEEKNGNVEVGLKYKDGTPVIRAIDRISKPGRRIYVKNDEIPSILSGKGIAVVSTSKGVMTGEDAKAQKLGGELICRVY